MRAFTVASLCASILLSASTAWAWDMRWTNAVSGNGDVLYDAGSSHGTAGTDEPPQTFHAPPPRDFADVDPEELDDYFDRRNKDYVPYALARVERNIVYNGQLMLPKGYYLIKAGDDMDGSPRVDARLWNAPQVSAAASVQSLPPAASTSTVGQNPQNAKAPSYRVFVIKRLGKVVAVVPIHRVEAYKPPQKEKLPRQALAWVEMENRHPVLKFYYKKRIYSTDFQ